jgi:hypothetical protein
VNFVWGTFIEILLQLMLYIFLYRKLHKEFQGGRVHIVEACGEVPLVNGKWYIFKQAR